jgi:hypothetical protein
VNRQHHLYPSLILVLDPDKQPYPRAKLMNLELAADLPHPIHVRRILPSAAHGIDVQRILASEMDYALPESPDPGATRQHSA